jgi:deoxyribodipyrimidine photo-lyase
MSQKGIKFKTFKDQVIFEKDEVVKPDRTPYTIYTPYSRSYPSERYLNNLLKIKPLFFPSLTSIGFESTGFQFPSRIIKTSIIEKYDKQRDYPGVQGTTRLSVHLRFGTASGSLFK